MSNRRGILWMEKRKGAVLVVVMTLAMLLLMAGGIMLQLMLNQVQSTKHLIDRAKTFALCEAGLNHALYKLGSEDSDLWTWEDYDFDPLKEAVTETIQEDWEFNGKQKDINIVYIRTKTNPEDKLIKVTTSY